MEISIAHSSSVSSSHVTLLFALELSTATWVVALSAPFLDRISHHSIAEGCLHTPWLAAETVLCAEVHEGGRFL